jgi:hypothetical protein
VVDSGGSRRFFRKIGLNRDRWKEPMTAYFDNDTFGEIEKVTGPGDEGERETKSQV